MIQYLQHKFALSEKGAQDMIKACITVCISDLVFMMPAGILCLLVQDLLNNQLRLSLYLSLSAIILLLIAFTQYLQYNSTFLATYTESGIRRTTIAEKIRKLPLSFFSHKNLTDFTTNMMNDCAQIETASSHWIPELVGALFSNLIVGISLFILFDWRLALAVFWVIPVAFFIVFTSSDFQKKAVHKNTIVQLELNDGIQECLETMKELRANNAHEKYLHKLNNQIKDVEKQALTTELSIAVYVSSAQMILKLGIGTTCVVGSMLLAQNQISISTFFLFLIIVSRIYDPVTVALQNFAAIIAVDVQCDRLDEILSAKTQSGTNVLTNKGYDIEFDNVQFCYNENTPVLNNITFKAKQGEITALIGPSGGGKTTITRLAARFWDTTQGKITIGGMDIKQIDPETLLSLYAIVFQDVTLFNNSVIENIRIGKKDATDEEVLRAAKLANCDAFVKKLPNGYNTLIGENGKELSGGERQRISIARAFLKDAPIILLDEATASLDVENETEIQTALSALIKDKTVIIIAHRMRTIANADHIIVLHDGIIQEEGTPSELFQKDGIYKHMLEQQKQSSNWKMN